VLHATGRGVVVSLLIVFCIVFCCSTAFGRLNTKIEKKTRFGTGVAVGAGLHQFHTTCIFYEVFFISGQFFKGIHEKQTSSGAEFTKGKTRYETFPERLVVDVQATIYKCPMKPDQIPVPGFGEGLMSDPSFELSWRDKSKNLTPVELLSAQHQHQTVSIRWDYFLELTAKDVSLANTLLIDVSLRRGTTHYQLAASLLE